MESNGKSVTLDGARVDYETGAIYELDYLHEARNAERFAANFADDPAVQIPRVFWDLTTSRVITMSLRPEDHRSRGPRRGRNRSACAC
jgi:predicted unusual protein kinase regulating ubiquinone biosynthesis (AarF/ABC1/UbiB family)